MTTMFAFPEMFRPHIEKSNIELPDDMENYDKDKYLAFHIFLVLHLGRTIDVSSLESNANKIAALSEEELRSLTLNDIDRLCLEYGIGDWV